MKYENNFPRLPEDPNLRWTTVYDNYGHKHPVVVNYLERVDRTTQAVLKNYPQAFALRVDLRYPDDYVEPPRGRPIINRFIDSLRSKVKYRQARKEKSVRVHPTEVDFIWAKEYGKAGKPHFHVILLFNRQAFWKLGALDPYSDGLYGMISQAWASALGWDLEDTIGLPYVPRRNPVYHLHCDQSNSEFYERASYLAKVATKGFGDGQHRFGSSR